MITPAYALTATERVLPRLALDFLTGTLDSRVTFTRSTTGTYINSSRLIASAAINEPRFDCDASTGVIKGLLIEESRTNVAKNSEDFSAAAWTIAPANVDVDATTAPDGTQTADRIKQQSITVPRQSVSFTNATAYSFSVFAKADTATSVTFYIYNLISGSDQWIVFDLSNQTINKITGAGNATIQPLANSWYRLTYTETANQTAFGYFAIGNTNGVFLWGAQVEVGAFPTSYIPNLSTGTTPRNADVVTMTGTNFSDWYVSSSAALAAVVIPSITTGTRPIWQLDDTTANEIIALRGNVADPELYIVDNGVSQAQLDAGTITAGTQYGLCAAFAANSCAVSQNGATPVTTATATMPTVTQARIGSDGSNFLNGAVRTLRYWPQRILNAETQAFSK